MPASRRWKRGHKGMDGGVQIKKPRLGDLLIDQGVISRDQLRIALTEQKREKLPLGKLLVKLGFATEVVILNAVSEVQDAERIDIDRIMPDPAALELLPRNQAQQFRVLPVSFTRESRILTVAISNIYDLTRLDQLRVVVGSDVTIKPLLAGESEVEVAIDRFYGIELSIDGVLHELETGEVDQASLQGGEAEYSQPVVRLVDALLSDAVRRHASDIHFEPERGFLRIRYRIDGVLRQVRALHNSYWPAMVVRLKVLSGMNIAEIRGPQDGRFSKLVSGREVDFRASVHPVTHGENFVLRILDRERGIVALDNLGLHDDTLMTLKLMLARPEGILLVTGPTGSGKTTTLYSMLNHINKETVSIMTLEDPVEYPLSMIRQTSVNEAAKVDFVNGIRSMLRQDPDVMLVGEIRDEQTAEMAMRAAMTGHQVFSTLHTNSAVGAISRLLDLGILPDLLAGNIIGIVGQRLVRKLCIHCREEGRPDAMEQHLLGIDEQVPLYRAKGCELCDHQGYRGRLALLELLKMDLELDELITTRRPVRELLEMALAKGFRPLAEDGIRRVLEGVTTLDELSRVVDLTNRL